MYFGWRAFPCRIRQIGGVHSKEYTPVNAGFRSERPPSIAMNMFLDAFKNAAAEGAAVELKMRLLAGKIPALQKDAHCIVLADIEAGLIEHFGAALSHEDRETLRLCRQLRNKVLHSDFRAARDKLSELGIASSPGGVVKIDLPVVTVAEVAKKIEGAKAGTEGIRVADTLSTDAGSVFGWFLEAGQSGDFAKASSAFKSAAEIVDRLAGTEGT